MRGIQTVDVCKVEPTLFWIGWALDEVVNLPADSGLIQIDLHILRVPDFVARYAVEADRNQVIAWEDPGSGPGRVWFNSISLNSLASVDPPNAIPRRCFSARALGKVQHPGSDEHRRPD